MNKYLPVFCLVFTGAMSFIMGYTIGNNFPDGDTEENAALKAENEAILSLTARQHMRNEQYRANVMQGLAKELKDIRARLDKLEE